MRYEHVCIERFGYVLPDEIVTSVDLEQRLAPVYARFGLHEGRIEMMSGIRERRLWPPATLPSEMSARAGRAALEASGFLAESVECLLHTSVSRDCLEPASAAFVHSALALSPHVMMFDISNACLGFLNGMLVAANMIELGQIKVALIVAGEHSRYLVESTLRTLLDNRTLTKKNLNDAFASLTIGSGAAALVMAHESVSKTGHRLLGGAVLASSDANHLCRGTADVGFSDGAHMVMSTDSETLLVAGCELAVETWAQAKRQLGWSNADVVRCFTHQVGVAHRDRLYQTLELDPSLDFSTLEFLGNVGSVSLPITMAIGAERNPPAPGDRIAMMGIGSGLNCVMLGVEW
ncbi:MAG: 3-oxoacyl-ACP synthase III [Phycisphaerales bacterium]|nr:MAG: 3-oxoacyl-ACP synthase III [Phycisphaerales bacterium]